MTRWEFTACLPMKLPSLSNARLHWSVLAKVKKTQRGAVALALRSSGSAWLTQWKVMQANPELRLKVTFIRQGPRRLDSDNLEGAFKAVRDEIADWVGIDDGSQRYVWDYQQQPGPYEVRLRVAVLQRGES